MKQLPLKGSTFLGAMLVLLVGLACSVSKPTPPEQRVEQTINSSSHAIKLELGPKVTMPASAMMIAMATADQGQPVNRHLEVHVFNKSSGARVTDTIPTVSIADKATGTSRALASVMACMTLKHRDIEPHFGDNVYLPGGKYTVTVSIGDESASFDVSL